MAFKVNYGLERAERNRAKQAKKDAKVKAPKNADGEEIVDNVPVADDADGGLIDGTTEKTSEK